ncbi:hypothetical protein GGI43DRAFT_379278 [Trichoderma evansii]
MTMGGQLGIPQPKPMELLEGFMAHSSTFHPAKSSQVFVLTMPGLARAQQPKVPGGAGTRTAVWRIHFCIHSRPQLNIAPAASAIPDMSTDVFSRKAAKARPTIPI